MQNQLFETIIGMVVLGVAVIFLLFAVKYSDYNSSDDSYILNSRFERADGLKIGAPVSIAGVKVGEVVKLTIDPMMYNAKTQIAIDGNIKIPKDSSLEIVSESLLGGKYLNITPGGDDHNLNDGDSFIFTQSAISVEGLIQKFIFNSDSD